MVTSLVLLALRSYLPLIILLKPMGTRVRVGGEVGHLCFRVTTLTQLFLDFQSSSSYFYYGLGLGCTRASRGSKGMNFISVGKT